MVRSVLGSRAVASFEHEVLVDVVRRRPDLVRELLRDRPGVSLGDGAAVAASIELSELAPVELRCDALIEFREPGGAVAAAVIWEAQRDIATDKWFSWPSYVANARSRLRCPVFLVIVTIDAAVARWARRPIALGHPGYVLEPIVVGPADVPRIADEAIARANPELAALSALAHPELAVAEAAALAVAELPEDSQEVYWETILAALPAEVRAHLEMKMLIKDFEPKTEFVRTLRAMKAEAIQKGREEGREQGREEGREQGRRDTLRMLLVARFGPLAPEIEAKLAAASADALSRAV